MNFLAKIKENNQTHVVSKEEIASLLPEAERIYQKNFPSTVYFERSIFINWTCSIADCKYCFLSTKPKHDPKEELTAIRSPASILAEVLVCKAMGWKVGYITGGLRVESTDYLISLIQKINSITKEKIMMNFGPYPKSEMVKLKPYVAGMGSAIESFDEELHNFICPSKPLKSLMKFLENLQEEGMQKLITIILGIGERKEDVEIVVERIKQYHIEKVQLCFLKPQENTIFNEVPPPNPDYMTWWIAKLRIACPEVHIKVALVQERTRDVELYLRAGANGFSRFKVFLDFNSVYAQELEEGCALAGRTLEGNFTELFDVDLKRLVENLPFDEALKKKILPKTQQYFRKLERRK